MPPNKTLTFLILISPCMNTQGNRKSWVFAFLGLALFLAGCRFPNQFANTDTHFPHAILVGRHVAVEAINAQPTSFWRCGERFRVPPGTTTVNPITGVCDFRNYPALEFTAIAGYRYTLTHQVTNNCHSVLLRERPPGENDERVVAQVEENRKKPTE